MPVVLKSLKIENFKTCKKVILNFVRDFVVVCGPNGSGKSSLIDAIYFVLNGSFENLRVTSPKELLHESDESTSVSVEITFNLQNGNFVLKRSYNFIEDLYHYFYDELEVEEEDYENELKKLNLYFAPHERIIMQQKIFNLINLSDVAKTEYFEKLSGSDVYKEDCDRLKNNLDQKNEEINQMNNKLLELNKQKHKMQKLLKSKEAIFNLQKNKDKTKKLLVIGKVFKIETEIEDLIQKYKEVEEKRNLLDVTSQNVEIKNLKQEQAKLSKLESKIADKLENVYKYFEQIEKQLKNTEENINCCKKSEKVAQKNYEKAKESHNSCLDEIQNVKNDLNSVDELLDSFSPDETTDLDELDSEHLSEYYKLKDSYDKKAEVEDLKTSIDSLDNFGKKQDHLNFKLKSSLDLLKQSEIVFTRVTNEKQEIESQSLEQMDLNEAEKLLNQYEKKKFDLNKRYTAIQVNLADCENRNKLNQQQKTVIYELTKKNLNIMGRLVDLCNLIDDKYKIAVTKILSRNMNAIVVDKKETAIKCIKLLKEMKFPPEKFFPLDNLQTVSSEIRGIESNENAVLAYNVLDFNANISKAVLYAVKNTLICKNEEIASEFCIKYKTDCVSLKGVMYNQSGIISGGLLDLESKAQAWSQKEIEKSKNELRDLKEQLLDVEQNVEKFRRLVNNLKENLGRKEFYESRRKSLEKEELWRNTHIKDIKKTIENIKKQKAELQKGLDGINSEISKKQKIVENIRKEVFSDFCKKLNIESIEKFEKGTLEYLKKKQERKFELSAQRSRLESWLETLKNDEKKDQEKVERWKSKVDSIKEKLFKQELKLTEAKTKLDEFAQKKAKFEEKIKKFQEDRQKISKNLREKVQTEEDLKSFDQELFVGRQNLISLKMNRNQLITSAEAKGLDLPFLDSTYEDNVRDFVSEDSSIDKLLKTGFECKLDFRNMPEKFYDNPNEQIHLWQKKIEDIENQLTEESEDSGNSRLGKKCLERINKEIEELRNPIQEAKKKQAPIDKEFLKVAKKRKMKLEEYVDSIREEITQIYRKLTGKSFAQVELLFLNPEEPYSGGISLNSMTQRETQNAVKMSGGEQTMLMIALLFAINKKNPSFIIFDEVDAPLDKKNIRSLMSYIKEIKSEIQVVYVTLKEDIISQADMLIGTSRPQGFTKVFTLLSGN